ncbi:MAG: type II toxin-antitoxin system HicA family toxin [bacterium]|nr:type II toxin-antitoxin system HicA family toxin [bacterium]
MPKPLSGKKVVKILCHDFGFSVVSQKGSHIKLQKLEDHHTITTIVPNHKELAMGTLFGVLNLAHIDKKDFLLRML